MSPINLASGRQPRAPRPLPPLFSQSTSVGLLGSLPSLLSPVKACSVKFRMLKAEVIEAPLYRRVTWTLIAPQITKLRTGHHRIPFPSCWSPAIKRADHTTLSYAHEGGLPSRVMFVRMAGAENRRPGEQSKTWHRFLVEDLKKFRGTERSTEHSLLVYEVETALWSTAATRTASGTGGSLKQPKGYSTSGTRTRQSCVGSATNPLWVVLKGMGGGEATGKAEGKPSQGMGGKRATAVDESRKETADRAARYQAVGGWKVSTLLVPTTAAAARKLYFVL